jgi:cation-transporting ATPase E
VTDSPADPAAHSSAPTNERTAGRVTDPATGLTAAEVADRVARGLNNAIPSAPTRTVAQIVKANVFAPINLVVGILAALVIAAGSPKDALFGGVIVANSVIGVVQELRAKKSARPAQRGQRAAGRMWCATAKVSRAAGARTGAGRRGRAARRRAQVVADGTVLTSPRTWRSTKSLLTGEADPVVKVEWRRCAQRQRGRRRHRPRWWSPRSAPRTTR